MTDLNTIHHSITKYLSFLSDRHCIQQTILKEPSVTHIQSKKQFVSQRLEIKPETNVPKKIEKQTLQKREDSLPKPTIRTTQSPLSTVHASNWIHENRPKQSLHNTFIFIAENEDETTFFKSVSYAINKYFPKKKTIVIHSIPEISTDNSVIITTRESMSTGSYIIHCDQIQTLKSDPQKKLKLWKQISEYAKK